MSEKVSTNLKYTALTLAVELARHVQRDSPAEIVAAAKIYEAYLAGRAEPAKERTEPSGEPGVLAGKDTITVAEAAKLLRIGRNAAYEAVNNRTIPTIRIGKRILVLAEPLRRMIEGAGK